MTECASLNKCADAAIASQKCYLIDIPPELRIIIFDHLFADAAPTLEACEAPSWAACKDKPHMALTDSTVHPPLPWSGIGSRTSTFKKEKADWSQLIRAPCNVFLDANCKLSTLKRRLLPATYFVCRKMRRESVPIFYRHTAFSLYFPSLMKTSMRPWRVFLRFLKKQAPWGIRIDKVMILMDLGLDWLSITPSPLALPLLVEFSVEVISQAREDLLVGAFGGLRYDVITPHATPLDHVSRFIRIQRELCNFMWDAGPFPVWGPGYGEEWERHARDILEGEGVRLDPVLLSTRKSADLEEHEDWFDEVKRMFAT